MHILLHVFIIAVVGVVLYVVNMDMNHSAVAVDSKTWHFHPELTSAIVDKFKCCDAATVKTNKMPASIYDAATDSFNFGRYHGSPKAMDFGLPAAAFKGGAVQRIRQLKEWSWSAVTDGREWFCGSALSQVQIGSGFFVYCFNAVSNSKSFHLDLKSVGPMNLLGYGSFFETTTQHGVGPSAASPMNGCIKWRYNSAYAEASHCFNKTSQLYEVKISAAISSSGSDEKKKLLLEYGFDLSQHSEGMTIIYPIGPHRVGASFKMAAAVTPTVKLELDGKSLLRSEGDASSHFTSLLDYTRSMFPRHTVWQWIAFSTEHATVTSDHPKKKDDQGQGAAKKHKEKRRLGFQLTSQGYPDHRGVSTESTVWIGGVAHIVNCAIKVRRIKKNDDPQHPPTWIVTIAEDAHSAFSLSMTFIKHGEHLEDFSKFKPLTNGALHHMWGVYSGSLVLHESGETFSFENVPGVLEDHDTVW